MEDLVIDQGSSSKEILVEEEKTKSTEKKKESFDAALFSLDRHSLFAVINDLWVVYRDQLENVMDKQSLMRGALLAQDRENFDDSSSDPSAPNKPDRPDRPLTNYEVEALDREEKGKMSSLTRGLWITLATCAMGAVVQGWSQQSLVGANLNWPVDLRIAKPLKNGSLEFTHPNGLKYFGAVNAIPYFAASILGAWVSDPLTDKYGRRFALFVAGFCSFVAPIGGAYCTEWWELLICRAIQGIGMGAKSSVVPILESEVSPPEMRGKLLVSWQTFVAIGIFLGAAANCVFEGQWRHQFGIAFLPALPLLCLCFVIRESPRWLIKKGQYGKAYVALKDLRETPLQAARDLYTIHAQLKLENRLFSGPDMMEQEFKEILTQPIGQPTKSRKPTGFFKRLAQLIIIPRNRHAVLSSCVVMTAQYVMVIRIAYIFRRMSFEDIKRVNQLFRQFSGINIYAFLATTIFGDSGIVGMKTLWFTFGFALTNAVFSAVTFFIIDRLGRRTLLIWSLIVMLPLLILTGHYFDVGKHGRAIALILVYTAVYSPGAGVVPFMYSSEVFPLSHREVGMSLAVSLNLGLAGVLAMVVPLYAKGLNTQKLLGTFAALDGFAAILVWLFMRSPEEATSLEGMNYFFLPRSMSYAAYQCKVVLPWALKKPRKFLTRTKHPKLPFVKWSDQRVGAHDAIETHKDV